MREENYVWGLADNERLDALAGKEVDVWEMKFCTKEMDKESWKCAQ